MGRRNLLAVALIGAVFLAACGGDNGSANPGANRGTGGAVATIHTVTGLEPVVRGLVNAYNKASDADVGLTVTPQNEGVKAALQGRPAILPGPWLTGVKTESVAIGRNLAIIAVPAGNPSQVTGVDAFAEDSVLDTTMCGADSPFGNFAALVVAGGGVQPDPRRVSSGCDADAVNRVANGELDAALVFRSNVQIPDGVEVVSIPDDRNLVVDIRYAPVATNQAAGSFAEFLQSDPAKQVLAQQGFLP